MRLALVMFTALLFVRPLCSSQQQGENTKPKAGPAQPQSTGKSPNVTPKTPGTVDTTGEKASQSGLIRAKISTSRPEVTVNGGYGIFADLENIGAKPVAIYSKETALVVQPEVTRSTNCVFQMYALFPTETYPGAATTASTPSQNKSPTPVPTPSASSNSKASTTSPPEPEDPRGVKIRLQPNEHYTIFWEVSTLNTTDPSCQSKTGLTPASFVPGEYAFTMDGKAYLIGDAGEEDPNYHTFTEKTVLRVIITQTLAMWAAAIGAIIGYLVTKLRTEGDFGFTNRSGKAGKFVGVLVVVRDVFSAALMGAVVTVIASRLSETQFPVKVSVNDFWGALTIGFFAYFIGTKLIDKLVGTFSASRTGTGSRES